MSIISKAIRYLGKKGIIGAIDVDSIVQHQASKVQDYQNPVYNFKTPMQLIAAGSHAILDGMADTMDRLIPGNFLDDIISYPLRKADFGIQVGTRILDPISVKVGSKIGTSIGNALVKGRNSKSPVRKDREEPTNGYNVEEEEVLREEEETTNKPNVVEIPKTIIG